jgi:hypothetical protein
MFRKSKRESDKALEVRDEKLWKELLQGEARSSAQAKKAIAYCRDCITTYDEWFEYNEGKWISLQRIVIVGGVVATLSGVITLPDEWLRSIPWATSFGWLRGVPAGIVTIAAGLLSSFTYKEDAVRNEVTANTLRNELVKFLCSAEPYAQEEAKDVSTFLNTICRLVDSELQNWSTLVTNGGSERK